MNKLFLNEQLNKKILAVLLTCTLLITSFSPLANLARLPLAPQQAFASSGGTCTSSADPAQFHLSARVGGVALDQAAQFLANMTDITGAYYDSNLDRIVFIGKQDTTLPPFNKDDMAVAIKAVIFNKQVPAVSIENASNDPQGQSPTQVVNYYGGIQNTNFGQTLFNADLKLKEYVIGYDENGNQVTSSVPGYQSVLQRYLALGPNPNYTNNSSRFWISPQTIDVEKNQSDNSFVFGQVKMQVSVEELNPNNDPKYNQAMSDFAAHHTQYYDQFAQETPYYAQAKELGELVGVLRWISDNNIISDFNWARDYTPKYVSTTTQINRIVAPTQVLDGHTYTQSGGVQYTTANTYDTNTSSTSASLETAAQAVPTTKQDNNWTFQQNGQTYQAVAVAADAFRSLGAYNTTATDMSVPIAGDMNLSLQRNYSSYSDGQYGIGRGWNLYQAQLFDNKPTSAPVTCTDGSTHTAALAIDDPYGHETFSYVCGQGYLPDDPSYHTTIVQNSDGSYTATLKNQMQYYFNANYQLLKILDKDGNTITYNYDGSGNLTSIADSHGHQLTMNYSTFNGQTLISSVSDWSGRTVQYNYDDQGHLLTVTDPDGGITTYTYDSQDRLATITDRDGKVVTTNTYAPDARLATQQDASGLTTTYAKDDNNKTITTTDNLGRSLVTSYDGKARILQQTDPMGKSTVYTYGTELAPLTVTDKNNNKTTFTYDANGNVSSLTYPDNSQITYQYDAKNNLTDVKDGRYGGILPKETTYTYDANNNLIQKNEAGVTTNYTYDSSGDMLTQTDPLNHTITWTRDSLGNMLTAADPLTYTTTYTYDSIGRLLSQTDPDGKAVSYTYDADNNVLTKTDANGTTTNTYDKENRLQKVTLPNNSVTQYAYNPAGSLNSVSDALNDQTSYGYDSYNNLTAQTDALNNTTTTVYDNLNRKTQSTTPLGNATKWEYDANGNITKRTDANGNATTYTYDALNRLKTITYPDTKTVTYTYDNRGNMTQMQDPSGTTTYVYDQFDRVTSYTNPYNQTVQYQYDNANNLTQLTYPDNKQVAYTYDANNHLIKVIDQFGLQTTYTYNKNGTLATRTYPNGVSTTYTYDATNRLIDVNHSKQGTTLADFSYTRDNLGNVTKENESGSLIPSVSPQPVAPGNYPGFDPNATPTLTPAPTAIPTPTATPTPPPPGVPYLVQKKFQSVNNSSSNAQTFTANVIAGDTILVAITNLMQSVSSVTDSNGDTFTAVTPAKSATGSSNYVELYYAKNVMGGPTIVTVNFTGSTNTGVGIYEYGGLDTIAPLDKTTSGSGTGTTANGGTLTTTTNNDLYFAVGGDTTGRTPTPGSGYTLENYNTATGAQSFYTEDKVAPQGSYTTNFTTNGGFWAVIGASFKPGIIGTPTPTPTAGPTPTPTTAPTPTPTPTPGASGPDLVITSLSAPASGTKNNLFTISTTVKNQGTTGLSNVWITVGYYYDISQAPTFTTTTSDSNQFFVGSLAAGASTTLKYVFGQFSTSGNHTIYALVNQDKAITESNYNNNATGPASITIAYAGPFNSFLARVGLNDLADILAVPHADAQTVPPPTNSMQYTYDALGRLNYASYSASLQYNYAYDSVGNRSSLISGPYKTTYIYDADNQYNFNSYYLNSSGNWFNMNSGSRIFNTYDKDGNLTNRGVGSASTSALTNAAISYDFDNHMTKFINSSNQPATYVYDGNGTRIARTTSQGTQHFAVDTTGDLDRLLVQADSNNNVTDEIDYGVGPISEGSPTNAASRFYMLEDGTSNIRLYTDYGGSLVEYYMYDPYGTVIYQRPSNLNISITNNGAGSTNTVNYTGPIAGNYDGIYKFQTQELDNPSQLYFLRARYYDPSIGRFITRDPVAGTLTLPMSQNAYQYSYNDPINASDPSGKYGQYLIFVGSYMLLGAELGGGAAGEYDYLTSTCNPTLSGAAQSGIVGMQSGVEGPVGQAGFALVSSGMSMGINKGEESPAEYHGNSLQSKATNYGYTLRNNSTQAILKYGETISPKTRYSAPYLKNNNAIMNIETQGSKSDIHQWQHEQILNYIDNNGVRPPLNKTNW